LAVAPVLATLLVADAAEVDAPTARRVGLLLTRMIGDAGDDEARLAMCGAAFADGRYVEALSDVRSAAVRPLLEKPAEALDQEDALTYVLVAGVYAAGSGGPSGWGGMNHTLGTTDRVWLDTWTANPLTGKEHLTDSVPLKMLELCLELARTPEELPAGALVGVWWALDQCCEIRPAAGKRGLELGLVELAVAQLRALGTPAERLSSGPAAGIITNVVRVLVNNQPAETAQAIHSAWVSSGYFDECLATMAAFEQRGVEHLQDTSSTVLYNSISVMGKCAKVTGCEEKIRGVASALGFVQDHSLVFAAGIGVTTGASATQLICTLWGREEAGSAFAFTQAHVDSL
jgi:hypothetical protein